MYEHYTDVENTGAPLVPMVEEPSDVRFDDGQKVNLDEAVWSHRIPE